MKRKYKLLMIVFLLIAIVSTGAVFAFADQENELDIPHNHTYLITAFDHGEAVFTCVICNDSYTDNFANHINEQCESDFDINEDGYVNVRDYSILCKNN